MGRTELGGEFYKAFGRLSIVQPPDDDESKRLIGGPAAILAVYLLPGANQVESAEGLYQKLKERAQVLNKVGFHVEAARLLATLDEVMPKSASLLELSFLTEEKQPATLLAAKAAQERDRVTDRRLNVRVTGVAPTDVEVADFLTKLTGKPFFEDVRMTGSKPRVENGHVMREFELYFTMNLNDVTGA